MTAAALMLETSDDTTAPALEPIVNYTDRLERIACLHRSPDVAFDLGLTHGENAEALYDRLDVACKGNDTLLLDFIARICPAARKIGRGERAGMFAARLDNDLGSGDNGLNLAASYSAEDYALVHEAAYLLINPPLLDDPADHGGEITLEEATAAAVNDLIGDTWLPELGQLAVIGPWGSGKTHVALHFVHKVGRAVDPTTGLPLREETFLGQAIGFGSVIYAPSEGGNGILVRLAKLDARYGRSPNIYVTRKICDLSNLAATVAFFRTAARKLAARGAPPVRAIVVDVLLAAFGAGAEENSNTDMNRILQNLRRVGRILNCAQVVVHHTGKGDQDEGRGASSFGGNLDMQLNVKLSGGTNLVAVKKLKEREKPAKPFAFHLANDVLEVGGGEIPESAISKAAPGLLYAHMVHSLAIDGGVLGLSEIDPAYKAAYYADTPPGTASGKTSRDRKAAADAGWIAVTRSGSAGKQKASGVKPIGDAPPPIGGDDEAVV